jgi:CheY-like chemotaxis protein
MSQKRILVVEDDPSIASLLRIFFATSGYAVQTADHGTTALKLCATSPPELVLLDVNLPDMDGYEIGKALRADLQTRQIPIVYVTARTQKADRLRGLGEVGAEYYLNKPFDMDELFVIVERLIDEARIKQQSHPITGLPSNELISTRLRHLLEAGQPAWALALMHLGGFEAYITARGAEQGADVLRRAVALVDEVLDDMDSRDDFLGHLASSPDFVLVSVPGRIRPICDRLVARFDPVINPGHASAGVIPQLRLSIGVLTDRDGPFHDIRQITEMLEKIRRQTPTDQITTNRNGYVNYSRGAGEHERPTDA